MKKILITCGLVAFALSAQAQTTLEDQDNIQDKLQQEPPREPQTRIENAAQQNAASVQNNRAQQDQQDLMKREKERSTGKEDKNPAETNPVTVKPATINEPVSKPLRRRN